jgi:hypothetical protein
MKGRIENIEQRLRGVAGALRLRSIRGAAKVASTDWQADTRGDVLRLRRGQGE